jgi:hypothetical protein
MFSPADFGRSVCVMWEIDEAELSRFRCHVGRKMSLALDENLHRKAMRGIT